MGRRIEIVEKGKYYKVKKSRYNSLSTEAFIGQKIRTLEEPDKDGMVLCRTYGEIKNDIVFNEKELIRC